MTPATSTSLASLVKAGAEYRTQFPFDVGSPVMVNIPQDKDNKEEARNTLVSKMNSIQVSLLGLLLSLATLTTANNVKPGVCPPERFLDYQNYPVHEFCQNDKDCSGNQKCCVDNKFKFCKPPAGERSGSCPSENTLIRQRCDDECTSDNECASGAKCCFRECGKRCLPLVGEKKGFCKSEKIIMCFQAERSLCFTDTGCMNDEKCCPHMCGNKCEKPLSERSGKCPTSIPNVSEKDQNCASDYDCGIGFKCCGSEGEKKCLRAECKFCTLFYKFIFHSFILLHIILELTSPCQQ
ncbi:uncharacterized protein [Pyxicephalus adspersus]|uniref:uncharacterized protein n=1 Tax=Pyxicephalus adspersus TaxID=30357 RepID=UPI003B5C48BD